MLSSVKDRLRVSGYTCIQTGPSPSKNGAANDTVSFGITMKSTVPCNGSPGSLRTPLP
jgi:hypothetical protein